MKCSNALVFTYKNYWKNLTKNNFFLAIVVKIIVDFPVQFSKILDYFVFKTFISCIAVKFGAKINLYYIYKQILPLLLQQKN